MDHMEPTRLITENKKVKAPKQEDSTYESMKLSGIPIKKAVFHKTVEAYDGSPETAFYQKGKPTRTASMWLTPYVLICEQVKGHRVIVPLANIGYTIPL